MPNGSPNGSFRIAIIGGIGLEARLFNDLSLIDTERHDLDTPFGRPSSAIITGSDRGVPIALLSRHGDGHDDHTARDVESRPLC